MERSNNQYFYAAGVSLYAIILGILITSNPITGFVFALVPIIFWAILQHQYTILVLLLFLMPFHSSPYLAQNIMGISGFKPFNLIAATALLFLFIRGANPLRFKDSLEKKTLVFLFIYFVMFSLVFFRSLENISLFSQYLTLGSFKSSKISYILSFYIRPSLYLVSFLVILKTVTEKSEIMLIVSVIAGVLFLLSCYIIIIGFTHLGEFARGRQYIAELTLKYLGMHYNPVGTIYLVCGPIILYKALGKNRFWIFNFILAFIALLFLQSRTALLTFCGSSFLLLFLLKRTKLLIVLSGVLFSTFLFLLSYGFFQGLLAGVDKGTADALLSGRVNLIWVPLMEEWMSNSAKLFFGAGNYGMFTSKLYIKGIIPQVSHAHNAFLMYFLDNGIILLSLLIYFIITYTIAAWSICRKIDTSLCWTFFVVIIAYLLGMMTEGNIYPSESNMLFFPCMALFINYIRIYLRADTSEQ